MPVELRSVSLKYTLESWVKDKGCRTDDFFETIDGAIALFTKLNPGKEVKPTSVVVVLSESIDTDGALEEYVFDNTSVDIDEPEWQQILKAAAWRLYQAYDKLKQKGA